MCLINLPASQFPDHSLLTRPSLYDPHKLPDNQTRVSDWSAGWQINIAPSLPTVMFSGPILERSLPSCPPHCACLMGWERYLSSRYNSYHLPASLTIIYQDPGPRSLPSIFPQKYWEDGKIVVWSFWKVFSQLLRVPSRYWLLVTANSWVIRIESDPYSSNSVSVCSMFVCMTSPTSFQLADTDTRSIVGQIFS